MMADAAASFNSSMTAQMTSLTAQLAQTRADLAVNTLVTSYIWRLTCGALVLFMQLGFSLLEAGSVRFKNTRSIMVKNVLDTCVCALAFWLFGYALAFGDGSKIIGWARPLEPSAPPSSSASDYLFAGSMPMSQGIQWFFQFTFAATSTTIIAGAVAERTHLWAYLLYNFFLSSLIYPFIAHIVWSENGLLAARSSGTILATNGILDNAGSMVVHVTGGVTALAGAYFVGPRIGRFDIDGNKVPFKANSVVYQAAGTLVLWAGFYGFNGGSVSLTTQAPLEWTFAVARVIVNTTLCAATSGFTVFALQSLSRREALPGDIFNGVIGGLVSACGTASVVEPYAAFVVGAGAGACYLSGVWCVDRLGIDDVVQATPTHLFCGSWGAVAAGLFATQAGIRGTYGIAKPAAWGLFYGGGWNQLGIQLLGLCIVYAWVGLTSSLMFGLMNRFGVLRVQRQEEEVGLDIAFHGVDEREAFGGERSYDEEAGFSRNFSTRFVKKRLQGWIAFAQNAVPWARGGGGGGKGKGAGRGGWGLTSRKRMENEELSTTIFGNFSLATYEANFIMEDVGEVEASSSGVYIGVHDGHGGYETSIFLRENLYNNLRNTFLQREGRVTAEGLKTGFVVTEAAFKTYARQVFADSPQVATVGSCSCVVIITATAVWSANLGDCRAVIGKISSGSDSLTKAIQLSSDHNLGVEEEREAFQLEHADTPDAVQQKGGSYRVKGKLSITRSFGDLYMKTHEFNQEPLLTRFRVSEPYHPPLLSAEPHINVQMLEEEDMFVIVASDGIWEYFSNKEAVELVASAPAKGAARLLIRTALQRAAKKHELGYADILRLESGDRRRFHDDMTAVVFFFDHASRKSAREDKAWIRTTSKSGGATARKIRETLNFRKPKTYQGDGTLKNRGGFGTLHGMEQLQPGRPYQEEEEEEG